MPERSQHDRARLIAVKVARRIRLRHQYANLVLPAQLRASRLTGRDAALATTLVYGSLRWQGFLDAVIDAAHKKHGRSRGSHSSHIAPPVRDILRIGAYELLFLDTPAYAAVSTSCQIAAADASTRPAVGLVDGLLRSIAARSRKEWEALLTSRVSRDKPLVRASIRTSHPLWIVHALQHSRAAAGYDESVDARTLNALLEADNADPPVTLCARPGLVSRENLIDQATRLGGKARAQKGHLSPLAVRIAGIDPARIPAVQKGVAGVEDEGSQLAVLALVSAPLEAPAQLQQNVALPSGTASSRQAKKGEKRWLDLCAGPGGKAALLAAFAAQRGARLVANEPQESREKLVEQNLRAVPRKAVEAVTRIDGRLYGSSRVPGSRAAFDRVLVDAPCSGLGALRRRPEARWHKQPDDITRLLPLQKALLGAGLDATRPGGVLAYVTCSPVLAETREIVDAVLASRSDVHRLDAASILRAALPGVTMALPPHGDVQLFSDLHDTDMMFVSLLRRTEG